MALTIEQKKLIIKEYEPILYLHPDEKYFPVRPDVYVQNAALWYSQPTSHDKRDWGVKPKTGDWPRQPLIPKKGISVNPADDTEGTSDTDGDGVKEWYLGHRDVDGGLPYLSSDAERELFLDFAGWSDGEVVDANSQNTAPNKELAAKKYTDDVKLKDSLYWCYAEVEELDTLTDILTLIKDREGLDLSSVFGKAWFVWYYFFYPIHEEVTRHCGEIIQAKADGDYEGDWAAVGVIIRQPAKLPWESGGAFTNPEYVGLSLRQRGLIEIPITSFRQGMQVHEWDKITRVGRHAKVYVARGSHNNYRIEGPKLPPSVPLSSATCEGLEEADEAIKEKLDEIQEEVDNIESTLVTLAKVGGGCAIGAIFGGWLGCGIGAIVGGIAAAIEASGDDSESSSDAVDDRVREESERDYAPEENNYGTIIKPDSLGTLSDESYAKSVMTWQGTPADKLVDRALQKWWPSGRGLNNEFSPGYEGRWGVMVQDDKYDRRSGIIFPDFKMAFLLDLAVDLSK